mmetsp:Transcript_5691/g.7687  ORF Transcript_5691/g.7687 Transcript_5691/m.7687 type:complete len:262 (-) Transcript_5691:138-923(-)
MLRQYIPSISRVVCNLAGYNVRSNFSAVELLGSGGNVLNAKLAPAVVFSMGIIMKSETSSSNLFCSSFHVSATIQAKKLNLEQVKKLEKGMTGFLGTQPRDDVPPMPRPVSQLSVPGYGSGGGGQAPFTPTKLLVKRKTYFKRCKFFLHCLEHEEATKASQARVIPIPAFRVGDVVEIQLVVPENDYKEGRYKGLVIKRVNRGLGSSLTLLNHNKSEGTTERTVPLYSPHLKKMTIIERRKVRRGKLTYMRTRKPSEYTFK